VIEEIWNVLGGEPPENGSSEQIIYDDPGVADEFDYELDPETVRLIDNHSIADVSELDMFDGVTGTGALSGDPSTYVSQIFDKSEGSIRKPETFQVFERAAEIGSDPEALRGYKAQLRQNPGGYTVPGLLNNALVTVRELGLDSAHQSLVTDVIGVFPLIEPHLVELFVKRGLSPRFAKVAAFGTLVALGDGALHAMEVDPSEIESVTEMLITAASPDNALHQLLLAMVIGSGEILSRNEVVDIDALIGVLKHVFEA
jgi:hypothetical protein